MTNVVAEQEKVGVGLIRIADLPEDVQAVIKKLKLDKDGDGMLDADELGVAFKDYRGTKKDNKNLRYSVVGLVLISILLVCSVFGASITATRLSKDTSVDPVSGIMYTKGSNSPIQTAPAVFKAKDINLHTVSIDYVSAMKTVEFNDGNVSFDVKGYARIINETILLVEGGSLIFDISGLKNFTGDVPTRLFLSIDEDSNSVDLDGRKLYNDGAGSWARFIPPTSGGTTAHVPPPAPPNRCEEGEWYFWLAGCMPCPGGAECN